MKQTARLSCAEKINKKTNKKITQEAMNEQKKTTMNSLLRL